MVSNQNCVQIYYPNAATCPGHFSSSRRNSSSSSGGGGGGGGSSSSISSVLEARLKQRCFKNVTNCRGAILGKFCPRWSTDRNASPDVALILYAVKCVLHSGCQIVLRRSAGICDHFP